MGRQLINYSVENYLAILVPIPHTRICVYLSCRAEIQGALYSDIHRRSSCHAIPKCKILYIHLVLRLLLVRSRCSHKSHPISQSYQLSPAPKKPFIKSLLNSMGFPVDVWRKVQPNSIETIASTREFAIDEPLGYISNFHIIFRAASRSFSCV